jgi:protocatechuate 3,4-dioxygenase beta subunit
MASVLVVLLALIAPAARGQQPAATAGTLTLRGVVISANDAPLPRVRVVVPDAIAPGLAQFGILGITGRGVLTDDGGRFTIQVPATASVRLAFTKARYVTQTADFSPRELNAQGSDIRVRMPLASVISGRVLDRSGTAVFNAVVRLWRSGAAASEPPLATQTNDLGEFRFAGLSEGSYVLRAAPPGYRPLSGPVAVTMVETGDGLIVRTSSGAETGNINLMIDVPPEIDQAAAKRTDPDPDSSGSLSGRIVDLDGAPIARAVVLVSGPNVSREVETDARGNYRIDRLSPGDYMVEARKRGFEARRYGQHRRLAARSSAISTRVAVRNGQHIDSIDVMIARAGVITGTIVDEFGEPMQDVLVSPLQLRVFAGHPRWVLMRGAVRTDDRGQYRLFDMLPGSYVVKAAVGETLTATSGYLPLFHPGTPRPNEATPTKVDFAATTTGIDFVLRPTATHTVAGVVRDSSGKAPAHAAVTLAVSGRSGTAQADGSFVNSSADGSFAFTNVGPGEYVVQAWVHDAGGVATTSSDQLAASFVTVTASDPPLLSMTLGPGATLAGRVRYEGRPDAPPALISLAALSTDRDLAPPVGDGWNSVSLTQPDEAFEFQGVFGPTLLNAVFHEHDWYLKSVVLKGQEIADTPFDFGTAGTFSDIEVVLSGFGASATGRVTDDRAAPVTDYTVVVFSTFRDRWFPLSRWVKTGGSWANGSFDVKGLPPGDYWIAALDPADTTFDLVIDSALLESLSSRATRISLSEGQRRELTLRLIRR